MNDLEATSLNLLAPKAARRASIEGVVATEAGTRAGPESGGVQRRAARPEGPPREERRALSLSCCVCVVVGGTRVEEVEGFEVVKRKKGRSAGARGNGAALSLIVDPLILFFCAL